MGCTSAGSCAPGYKGREVIRGQVFYQVYLGRKGDGVQVKHAFSKVTEESVPL